jgi:prolyl oligopeptidase
MFVSLQINEMRKVFTVISIAAMITQSEAQSDKYPKTKKVDTVDVYFGTKVSDPYRWLEDDNSKETAEWVKQENAVTYDYLSKIPFREKVKTRLTQLWNYEKISAPVKHGAYYYFYKNDGIQNQSVLYKQKDLGSEATVALDPNKLSTDGTVALGGTGFDKKGKYMAYAFSKAGSDWEEINIIEVETGKKLPDALKWVKFSGISFKGDGFYYSRYDAPTQGKELSKKNEYHKVYFHKIGEDQSKDVLVYEDRNNPLRNFGAGVTDDERFLIITGSESTSGNNLLVKDLNDPKSEFKTIVSNFENDFNVIDNNDDILLVQTNYAATNYQLIGIDFNNPSANLWRTIIGQTNDLLKDVTISEKKLIANFLVDVQSRLLRYNFAGELLGDIELPQVGMVDAISSNRESSELFFTFQNWTTPQEIYKYDVNKNNRELYKKPTVPFSTDLFETKQVFYNSKDGTKIPMFITYKKGLEINGNNPCFLYGYGGFNISVTPSFSASRMVFLENGGIFAVANLRGGGEYGEKWHKAGTVLNKQNVFDDFISAAEFLIKEKYTSSDKLAIHGRSNGGLLIGAVMTQRPDLFKVALPGVGVLDMLRYHKFTIGWAWATDYGTSADEKEFSYLLKYSPVHNVKQVAYPATMVVTGDHDDRVVPAHSFKFAATLQANQQGSNPTLIRIDVNAGHGAGKPTSKQIDEWSDIWSFVMYNLGMKY